MAQITVEITEQEFEQLFGIKEPSGLFHQPHTITGYPNPNGINPFRLVMNKLGRCYWLLAHDNLQGPRFSGINVYYQGNNARLIRTIYPNAKRIIDVGANVGNNTIAYSEWAEHVESFEPTPTTKLLLEANIKIAKAQNLHGIYWEGDTTSGAIHRDASQNVGWYTHKSLSQSMDVKANITVHDVAVTNVNQGTVSILDHLDHGGHNHIQTDLNKGIRKSQNLVQVPARTIDSYNFEDVDVIKIDVEGAEKMVLDGAMQTIDRCRPAVQFEIVEKQCKKFGYTPQDLYDPLIRKDYVPVCAVRRPMNREQRDLFFGKTLTSTWQHVPKYMDRLLVPSEIHAQVDYGIMDQAQSNFDSIFQLA